MESLVQCRHPLCRNAGAPWHERQCSDRAPERPGLSLCGRLLRTQRENQRHPNRQCQMVHRRYLSMRAARAREAGCGGQANGCHVKNRGSSAERQRAAALTGASRLVHRAFMLDTRLCIRT
jgi:hypothetical protein